MEKSKVYFIKEVSPENVVHAYEALGVELKGNVAVKLHSGEPGNQNFLRPDFMKPAVDCDCCAVAEDPKLGDIGILSSLDPVALDQACLDLVYASDDPGKGDLIKRIESRNGVHTIEAAAALGVGSREYELITL